MNTYKAIHNVREVICSKTTQGVLLIVLKKLGNKSSRFTLYRYRQPPACSWQVSYLNSYKYPLQNEPKLLKPLFLLEQFRILFLEYFFYSPKMLLGNFYFTQLAF